MASTSQTVGDLVITASQEQGFPNGSVIFKLYDSSGNLILGAAQDNILSDLRQLAAQAQANDNPSLANSLNLLLARLSSGLLNDLAVNTRAQNTGAQPSAITSPVQEPAVIQTRPIVQATNTELTPEQVTQNNLDNAFGDPNQIITPTTQEQVRAELELNAFGNVDNIRTATPPPTDPYNDAASPTTAPVSQATTTLPDSGDPYNPTPVLDQTVRVNTSPDTTDGVRPVTVNRQPENSANNLPPMDWRVRIALAPSSNYLYNAQEPGILSPLRTTRGVIFPYTPTISVSYVASYDMPQLTHSNFKYVTYQGSSVENITVTGDFTAQDRDDANYMLAVIHFFRSATKMFYGQDQNPSRGVPPPLVYLSGHGAYQFDHHPAVITNFTYSLPGDVDYINAYPNGTGTGIFGRPFATSNRPGTTIPGDAAASRKASSGLGSGGTTATKTTPISATVSNELTRVPTKINIQVSLMPVITRAAISNQFSLRDYASGKLLQGSKNPGLGGGVW